jgi:DNA primase
MTLACALDLRWLLTELGLVSFVKTTGSRGAHVVVPVKRSAAALA